MPDPVITCPGCRVPIAATDAACAACAATDLDTRQRTLSQAGPWLVLSLYDHPYEVCGVFEDGRPFFLRERGGHLTLRVADKAFPLNVRRWPFLPDPVVVLVDHAPCTDAAAAAVLSGWLAGTLCGRAIA